jgi:predicted DNA-binding transcriptional regulator AlpA
MQSTDNLAAQAVETPAILTTLSEVDARRVMARLVEVAAMAYRAWVETSDREQLAKHRAAGDRLLTTKEVANRMGCAQQTLVRGWKEGRYPFMLKDGGRLVGSEGGLERWIAARTRRQSQSH